MAWVRLTGTLPPQYHHWWLIVKIMKRLYIVKVVDVARISLTQMVEFPKFVIYGGYFTLNSQMFTCPRMSPYARAECVC